MADEESSPRPFRRERNLSNRNFNKRSSNRRRFSTESQLSTESKTLNNTNSPEETEMQEMRNGNDVSLASIRATCGSIDNNNSYSDTESNLKKNAALKMHSIDINLDYDHNDDVNNNTTQINNVNSIQSQNPTTPQTPDPAFLDVKQKLLLFENLGFDASIIFKTSKHKSKSSQSLLQANSSNSLSSPSPSTSGFQDSIDEEHSEDEVESIKDAIIAGGEEDKKGIQNDFGRSKSLDRDQIEECNIPVAAINQSFLTPIFQHAKSQSEKEQQEANVTAEANKEATHKSRKKDFPRNFRSRPKTEVLDSSFIVRPKEADKFNSLHYKPKHDESDDDEEEIELRDKSFSCVEPILEELIKTEESYVENLWIGINNYGNIFQRSDLPVGLRGKKYVLFGNIEQIAEFHRDEFLPMLQRNKHDLKRIFDEFRQFIDNNYFYGYVLFTMNKKRSLKLCDVYKNYFKLLQSEIDDKLGINSFLVQPIQRMARYPLLLQQFITTLFKNRDFVMKPIIESCCRLEKKLRNLLITTNESEIINDIVCVSEANEGKFRKVSEFHAVDYTLKRSYRSKVFIFDKCIIYTEIKGKQLIFHGRYPCEHIGITSKLKQFTLYYDQRKQQECDFIADQALIDQWLDLIREMISAYAAEERKKIKEIHSHEYGGEHAHRKPVNLSLFRDSNRFSSDSGIGNIWIVPKPEQEEATSNRTTWYAVT